MRRTEGIVAVVFEERIDRAVKCGLDGTGQTERMDRSRYDDEVGGYYEDDANIIQEYCILTATDIKNNLRRLYGECYDYVVWEGAEENEDDEAV